MEDLTIVDQIMKKIEENYRGVFTINGDDQLSSEIYQKIQSSQKICLMAIMVLSRR